MFGPNFVITSTILASAPAGAEASEALVTDPAALLAILLSSLAVIFWAASHPTIGKFFRVVPSLVFCYFVPTTLTTLGIIPDSSPLYNWIREHVLPASLALLILALDLPGIIRLGPKAGIMLLAGTAGIVIGGPIALLLTQHWLPDDAWQGLTALSGSWIGGGANFVALGEIADTSAETMGLMVVPDVVVANVWMGFLLFLSGKQRQIDARTGANAEMIRDLERRMTDFQERVTRVPSLADLILIVAIGFSLSYVSIALGKTFDAAVASMGSPEGGDWVEGFRGIVSASTWKYILVTAFGVLLSFTRARNLEGAGASKVGSVFLYLIVACIGASANFSKIFDKPENAMFLVTSFIWMAVHITVLLTVAKLIRAPIFFVAVGSQANIGGAASAPVVAAAFHPSLAPVGVLLAIAGYVLGTYAGIVCMRLLKVVAGA